MTDRATMEGAKKSCEANLEMAQFFKKSSEANLAMAQFFVDRANKSDEKMKLLRQYLDLQDEKKKAAWMK